MYLNEICLVGLNSGIEYILDQIKQVPDRTIFWHNNIHRSRKFAPVVLPNLLSHHERVHVIRLQSTNLRFSAVRVSRIHDLVAIHIGVSGVTHMKPLYHVTRHGPLEAWVRTPSDAHTLWAFNIYVDSFRTVWNYQKNSSLMSHVHFSRF